jgi:hypothetical protein
MAWLRPRTAAALMIGGCLRLGGHYSALRKGQGSPSRIHMPFPSPSGQALPAVAMEAEEMAAGSTAWIDPCHRECFIASASDERSGILVAQFACPNRYARGVLHIHQKGVRATWRPRCRSIVHISLGYTTDPLESFRWIVLMMTLPSNPPRVSSTATMWSFGRWTGL